MSDHFIYIIATMKDGEACAPVKVGITNSVSARLRTIQTSCPAKVDVYFAAATPDQECARLIERSFHKVMAKKNTHGEWFDIKPGHARFYLMIASGTFLNVYCGLAPDEVNDALATMGFHL